MSESFICRRGGVGTPFAVIGVTYPEGSTCTCSDGTKTLTAKGTSGRAMFSVPTTGTWTVSYTNGTDTASEDVSITAKGQVETVVLTYYDGVLYSDGTFTSYLERCELVQAGSLEYNATSFAAKTNASSISYAMIAFKRVNLTKFSTLTVEFNSPSTYKDGTTLAVVADADNWLPTSTSDGALAYAFDPNTSNTNTQLSLDVEAISGLCDVVVGVSTQGASWRNGRHINYTKVLLT